MSRIRTRHIWNVFHGDRDDGFWWGASFIQYHQTYVLADRINVILEEL